MYVFHVQPLGISESNVVSFLANSALERSLSSVDPRWRDLGREGAIVGVELQCPGFINNKGERIKQIENG